MVSGAFTAGVSSLVRELRSYKLRVKKKKKSLRVTKGKYQLIFDLKRTMLLCQYIVLIIIKPYIFCYTKCFTGPELILSTSL